MQFIVYKFTMMGRCLHATRKSSGKRMQELTPSERLTNVSVILFMNDTACTWTARM